MGKDGGGGGIDVDLHRSIFFFFFFFFFWSLFIGKGGRKAPCSLWVEMESTQTGLATNGHSKGFSSSSLVLVLSVYNRRLKVTKIGH